MCAALFSSRGSLVFKSIITSYIGYISKGWVYVPAKRELVRRDEIYRNIRTILPYTVISYTLIAPYSFGLTERIGHGVAAGRHKITNEYLRSQNASNKSFSLITF